MFRLVISIVTFALASAFTRPTATGRSTALKMSSVFPENPTNLVGDLAPVGFFDPIGLSAGKDEATLKQWRDAEIKHGRVCMLATVGILTQELLKNPLGIDGPGIRHFDLVDAKFPEFGELFILLCGFIEGWTIKNKWESKQESLAAGRAGILKPDVDAGDLGWDPLEWFPTDPTEQAIIKTKELQNGRLAMLAFAGIVAQELLDGKEVLCHFQKICE